MLRRGICLIVVAALAACASNSYAVAPATRAFAGASATGAGKIKHVIYIVQENRSFDDLFQGYPGADTVSVGKSSTGQPIALVPLSLSVRYDLDHSAGAMFGDCDGTGKLPGTKCRMDGFDKEAIFGVPSGIRYPMYVYVPHAESKPYFDMAHEWVLSDRTFASQLDESFVAHQYIIAAQAQASVNVPSGPWGCEGIPTDQVHRLSTQRVVTNNLQPPCFDYTTLGDELDAAKLSWRFYTSKYGSPTGGGFWSGYQAVKHIVNGPDWANVIVPQKTFLTDVANGKLAAFTWITPTCKDSDHSACGGGYGPSWVAALVNAVGKSPFWNSTAIFVQWDDWGGMYDHVAPTYRNFDSVGFRVPLLVISPYAKANYVSHVPYETTSVLRFAEDLFGLPQLTSADTRATSPAGDCFNFAQKPRPFVPIAAPLDAKFFQAQATDDRQPDDG